jgi:hypothetical protein
VSFAAITLCVASQRVFIVVVVVYFVMTQSGNFWIHPRILVLFQRHFEFLFRKHGGNSRWKQRNKNT